MIRIELHSSKVEADLRRLANGPSSRDLLKLDAILSAQFTATQAKVHIDTTSLKNSGKHKANINRATDVWQGEISYGGPSKPIPLVKYAPYEQARGGNHDFLKPAVKMSPAYERVILNFFKGRNK